MASSFKGLDLFGSGPHVFEVGRQGRRVVSLSAVGGDPSLAGTFESGDWEPRVEVTGRLQAGSESALWALRDAIAAQAAFGVSGGDLIDQHGRAWSSMKLLEVNWGSAVDRGRVLSIGYTAEFGVTQ
jgi:hypothetical protein